MKHLTLALLQWVANGDQGQNIRNRVFPLNTGRSLIIVSWRTTNRFVELQRSLVSLLKRSVASSSILLSRRDPRVAQRETYSRRSGSRPPFVDVALSAMRSDLHDPFSKQAMKSNMAGEADLRNTVCLLQSRCATRGRDSTKPNGPQAGLRP